MLRDYSMLDLSQMTDDLMDYMVILDGILEQMPNSDPDYTRTQKLEEHVNGILSTIEDIWEDNGGAF